MCGRYVFYTDTEIAEIKEIIKMIEEKNKTFQNGEIFPTNKVPALFYDVNRLDADTFMWGFPKYNQPGVIINARCETVEDKPTFKDSFKNRRCVIPAMGFYEWDKHKQKYLFTDPHRDVLYMAGIYRPLEGANRFVILTTAANASMAGIHDRMPIILERNQLEGWCNDYNHALEILHSERPCLNKVIESPQPSLF